MASTSRDTFANTNPAFCALILHAFVEGYQKRDAEGVPLPSLLFTLPVILSADLIATFSGTNAETGLLTWVGRHPQVTIDLRQRVTATAQFTREALLFGFTRRVLAVTDRGLVTVDSAGLRRKLGFPAADDRNRLVKYARQFGRWVADVRSVDTVFACLGMNR